VGGLDLPAKVPLLIALVVLLYALLSTVAARKENTLYASVWYGVGAIAVDGAAVSRGQRHVASADRGDGGDHRLGVAVVVRA